GALPLPQAAGISDGGLAPLVLGALGAKGLLHSHNVAAAWQGLDPEEANVVECSAPRTGDGEPSHRGARGDNRRVHRLGPPSLPRPLPRPNHLRRAQTIPIHASLVRRFSVLLRSYRLWGYTHADFTSALVWASVAARSRSGPSPGRNAGLGQLFGIHAAAG